jgi:hypothetical protein
MVRGDEKNEKNEKNPCFGTILREKARAKWNEWVTFYIISYPPSSS